MQRLIEVDVAPEAPIALLNARVSDPRGYGRVIRRRTAASVGLWKSGRVARGASHRRDLERHHAALDAIGSGQTCSLRWSPKGEYYLPQLVNLARQQLPCAPRSPQTKKEVLGVNDQHQLAQAEAILRRRTIATLLDAGVTIVDPTCTYIEPEVSVEPGVVVHPGCHLRGQTRIGSGCQIGPNSYCRR